MLGDRFDAPRAVQLGVVNRMVPPAAVDAEAMALATRLANGPAHAYGRTKALLEATLGQMLNAQLGRETESFAACAASEEFVEGVRAFLEKRRPDSWERGSSEKTASTRWIGLAAVATAGLLSGCYYYPYGYSPWGYPYPYPYRPAIHTGRVIPIQRAGTGGGAAIPAAAGTGGRPHYPQPPAPGHRSR